MALNTATLPGYTPPATTTFRLPSSTTSTTSLLSKLVTGTTTAPVATKVVTSPTRILAPTLLPPPVKSYSVGPLNTGSSQSASTGGEKSVVETIVDTVKNIATTSGGGAATTGGGGTTSGGGGGAAKTEPKADEVTSTTVDDLPVASGSGTGIPTWAWIVGAVGLAGLGWYFLKGTRKVRRNARRGSPAMRELQHIARSSGARISTRRFTHSDGSKSVSVSIVYKNPFGVTSSSATTQAKAAEHLLSKLGR